MIERLPEYSASHSNTRVGIAIAEYLTAMDCQSDFDLQEWLSKYADISHFLQDFLSNQVRFGGQVAEISTGRDEAGETPQRQLDVSFPEKVALPGFHNTAGQQLLFGPYELLREIGRGGMGVVYAARHVHLKREVALKVLRYGPFATEDDRRRFHREAEAVARLDHPGIIPIYEVGQQDNLPYFAMKLAEGGSLRQWIHHSRDGDSLPTILGWMLQISAAIHHAHQRGVLHRDLKPANILLDEQNKPFVADFGLAKDADSQETTSGRILGTPGYMAPEQVAGESTMASDIYSLGAVMYALLTRQAPIQSTSFVEFVRKLQSDSLVSPRHFNPKISRDVETICLKCLRVIPEHRYASAGELHEDLLAVVQNRPIRARPISWAEASVKALQRNWQYAMAYSLLATVILAATVWGIVTQVQNSRAAVQQKLALEADGLAQSIASADVAQLEWLLDWEHDENEAIIAALQNRWHSLEPTTDDIKNLSDSQRIAGPQYLNLAIALLPQHPELADPLWRRLLSASAEEVRIVGKRMARHVPGFQLRCQQSLHDGSLSSAEKLRITACMGLLPASKQRTRLPDELSGQLIDQLLSMPPIEFAEWTELLKPLLDDLSTALHAILLQAAAEPQQRLYAVELLSQAYTDDAASFFEMLIHSLPAEFSIAWRRLDQSKVTGLKPQVLGLAREFIQKTTESQDRDEERLRQASRAGIALVQDGQWNQVVSLLGREDSAALGSFLIRDIPEYGISASDLWNQIIESEDDATRFGLLCCLASYPGSERPETLDVAAEECLTSWFLAEPDSGIKAICGLILRRWEKQLPTESVSERVQVENLRWFVNGQQQLYVIVDAQGLCMGSQAPEWERDPDELPHRRFIGRKLAVAATEVTRRDFLKFQPEAEFLGRGDSTDGHRPMGGLDWYSAAAYCNWLSQQEEIPEDQWCYEPNSRGVFASGMRVAADAVLRTGYRMPTEAEWEYVCRAGSSASRFYGDSLELLPRYAWTSPLANDRSQPVGQLLPNRFGLFDTLGNVYEWCQDVYHAYPGWQSPGAVEISGGSDQVADNTNTEEIVALDTQRRCIRGGSFDHSARHARSAYRTNDLIVDKISNNGLRPVRTLQILRIADAH